MYSHPAQFEVYSTGATKEYSLEKAMIKMYNDWEGIEFGHSFYKETDVPILAGVDDIQTQLEDQIAKTQTMKGSPFIKPFENEIKGWEKQLVTGKFCGGLFEIVVIVVDVVNFVILLINFFAVIAVVLVFVVVAAAVFLF